MSNAPIYFLLSTILSSPHQVKSEKTSGTNKNRNNYPQTYEINEKDYFQIQRIYEKMLAELWNNISRDK